MSLSAVASGILAVEERAVSSDVIVGTTFPAATATIPIAASMIPRLAIAIAIAIDGSKFSHIWYIVVVTLLSLSLSADTPTLEVQRLRMVPGSRLSPIWS